MYLNENDPFAAAWLRRLWPDSTIDERDIRNVSKNDLQRTERCHFFAGIGGALVAGSTLDITAASLTATVANQSKTYGADDQAFYDQLFAQGKTAVGQAFADARLARTCIAARSERTGSGRAASSSSASASSSASTTSASAGPDRRSVTAPVMRGWGRSRTAR